MHLHFLNGHPDTEIHNSHPSQLSLTTQYHFTYGVWVHMHVHVVYLIINVSMWVHVHTQPTTKCLPEIRQV